MKHIRNIGKYILLILLLPIVYFAVALLLTFIPVREQKQLAEKDKTIYLNTNGVHLDLILPKNEVDSSLLAQLEYRTQDQYFSFGWGDENFYLNTPTWGDLTVKNAIRAMFLKSSTLVHLTKYSSARKNWTEVQVSDAQLTQLNEYLFQTFALDEAGEKVILENKGYSDKDDFYKAKGNYSCLHTCNSWANRGLKKSGLKACLWTPFDFGVLRRYKNHKEDQATIEIKI